MERIGWWMENWECSAREEVREEDDGKKPRKRRWMEKKENGDGRGVQGREWNEVGNGKGK